MPEQPAEWPFLALSPADPAGEDAGGAVPAALFDLAVNRAALVLRGLGRADALAAWHARTRFARRIPLSQIRAALAEKPAEGEWHWAGGQAGGWRSGKARVP